MGGVARPLLRGWLHAAAVLPACAGAAALAIMARDDALKQATLLVYGAALVLLFGISALYHRGRWSVPARERWRRADHATIYVMIAATYTPVTVNLLQGWDRAVLLAAIWLAAGAGASISATPWSPPRALLTALYIATGWMAVIALPQIYARVGAGGLALLGGGGLLFSAGAVAYALQRPRLWPRVFGYHELFHLLVLAASALFFAFMAAAVVPAARV